MCWKLVAAKIGADGTRHELPPKRGRRVISAATAAELNTMLRGVVNDGTGLEAQISGYTVAGKTGTSRKPPYEPPRYMASFAGFAPAESPRLAAIVVIDQPGTNNNQYFGGKVAAPLFSTIMQYALRLERVPPTGVMSAQPTTNGAAIVSATKKSEPSTPEKSGAASTRVAAAQNSQVAAGILGRHVP